MGSFVSVLLAPVLQLFAPVEPPEEEPRPLSELMEILSTENDEDPAQLFRRMCRRLHQFPEEAACYCHTVDPSPLQQLLVNTPSAVAIPVQVIRAFLDAYEDAAFTSDAKGVTPLLAAAKRVPVVVQEEDGEAAVPEDDSSQIVQLLLQANACAAQQPDSEGRLPLHYARSDVNIAHQILAAYPSAVRHKDQDGRLPLHFYCQFESIRTEREAEIQNDDRRIQVLPNPDVARLLLQAASFSSTTSSPAVEKDKNGVTPLDLLYQSLQSVLENNNNNNLPQNQGLETLWEILTLLVHSASPTPTTPFVHALVSLSCPAPILQEALRRFPQQAVERDAQGRTPLLLAVSLLDSPNNNTQAVIGQLLQTNRRAARMTDHEGRLAIDVLSEKQHAYNEQLYDLLVQAEPRAIDTRDLKNKQHPFLTAAMAGNSNGVYHLLRAKPHVIRYFLNEC